MESYGQFLVFTLNEQRYALPLSAVERVVRAVEITCLPRAPEVVLGVINVEGEIIPAVSLQRRLRLFEHELSLSDQLILARTARRRLALVVDQVLGIVEPSDAAMTAAESVVPGIEFVQGILKMPDGLVLIHDLDRFLSLDEERTLDCSLVVYGSDHIARGEGVGS